MKKKKNEKQKEECVCVNREKNKVRRKGEEEKI